MGICEDENNRDQQVIFVGNTESRHEEEDLALLSRTIFFFPSARQ